MDFLFQILSCVGPCHCTLPHSLSVQELHEGTEDVVGVRLGRVAVGRSFDLVKELRHLAHAASDARQEARRDDRRLTTERSGIKTSRNGWKIKRKDDSLHGRVPPPTEENR